MKQELPEIPKYVADWIIDLKSKKINLLENIYDFTHGEDIYDYIREQGNLLMRAWLDGFIIANEGEAYMRGYTEELNDGIIRQGDAQPLPLYIVEWLDNNINRMDKWKLAPSLISANKHKADQRIYRWTLEPGNMDKFLNALSNGYVVEKEDINWLKDKIFEKAWGEYDSAYIISLESLYEILDQVDCLKSKN